jgi:hypothetical protein
MKNIHVIQTDKPSRLAILGMSNTLQLFDKPITFKTFGRSPQNIYITSDEEPKGGDYAITTLSGNSEIVQLNQSTCIYYDFKIILTTDQDLINDDVTAIDDEFLEWFVQNQTCDEVETKLVEFEVDMGLGDSCIEYGSYYKIIIPSEKSKQQCLVTKSMQLDAELAYKSLPKQETPEEVKDLSYWKANAEEDYMKVPISVLRYISELEEKSYSDEEVDKLISLLKQTTEYEVLQSFRDKVEQFKKK